MGFLLTGFLLLSLAFTGFLPAFSLERAAAAPVASNAPGAGISVVNGRSTRIAAWPWQVAIAGSKKGSRHPAPRRRTFCGGAVIAPDLVLTAGHCVAGFKRSGIRKLQVISGRTWLNNEKAGQVRSVRQRLMPVRANGRPRYRETAGGAIWDVAILRLAKPLSAEPIQLAGSNEYGSWEVGS